MEAAARVYQVLHTLAKFGLSLTYRVEHLFALCFVWQADGCFEQGRFELCVIGHGIPHQTCRRSVVLLIQAGRRESLRTN